MIKLVKKTDSRLMRAINFLLRPLTPAFMSYFWTTIGDTIYVPSIYDNDANWGSESWRARHAAVLAHEHVHVEQFKNLSFLVVALLYLGPTPLPIFFSYGRWCIEREAYILEVRASKNPTATINRIVDTLWNNYGWCWPKAWMRKWFTSKINR